MLHLRQCQKVVESLGVPRVLMIPDEFLAQNVARETDVEILARHGHCEVHERFTPTIFANCEKATPT